MQPHSLQAQHQYSCIVATQGIYHEDGNYQFHTLKSITLGHFNIVV